MIREDKMWGSCEVYAPDFALKIPELTNENNGVEAIRKT